MDPALRQPRHPVLHNEVIPRTTRSGRCRLLGKPWQGWRLATGAVSGLLSAGLPAALAQGFFNPYQSPLGQIPTIPAGVQGLPGDNFLIGRGMPYNSGAGTGRDYNFKIGPVKGSVSAGSTFTYVDNINLSSGAGGPAPEDELTSNPSLNVGLHWEMSEYNTLRMDFGIGYVFYMNHPELNRISLNLTPNSTFDYRFIIGDVRFAVYDRISTPGGSGFAPRNDITGDGSIGSVDFQRLSNSAGLSAAWAATRSTTVTSGYDYTIDRGLGDSFALADHDTHSLSAAIFERLDPRWTVGLSGGIYQNTYAEGFQSGSHGYGAGPVLNFQPTRNINFSASVRYQVSYSDRNGANGDTSGFGGVTYNLAATHTINRHLRHGVNLGRNSDLGIGANFNDTFNVAYNLGWTFAKALGLNFGVNYSSSTQSGPGFDFVTVPAGTFLPAGTLLPDGSVLAGPVILGRDIVLPVKRQGESADTLSFSVGTGMPITRNLSASLGYSHYFRLSNLAGHGYHQNTVTLALNYRF